MDITQLKSVYLTIISLMEKQDTPAIAEMIQSLNVPSRDFILDYWWLKELISNDTQNEAAKQLYQAIITFSPAIYWQNTLLGFCAGMAQAVMYVYLPELFPTRTRAACMGICLNGGRFVTTIAVLFMGVFVWFFGGYREALCVFASIYVVGLGFAYLGPETKHQELLS